MIIVSGKFLFSLEKLCLKLLSVTDHILVSWWLWHSQNRVLGFPEVLQKTVPKGLALSFVDPLQNKDSMITAEYLGMAILVGYVELFHLQGWLCLCRSVPTKLALFPCWEPFHFVLPWFLNSLRYCSRLPWLSLFFFNFLPFYFESCAATRLLHGGKIPKVSSFASSSKTPFNLTTSLALLCLCYPVPLALVVSCQHCSLPWYQYSTWTIDYSLVPEMSQSGLVLKSDGGTCSPGFHYLRVPLPLLLDFGEH